MDIQTEIKLLAKEYSTKLDNQIQCRTKEMEEDDTSHYLIYRVLGINADEGRLIDLYQNKGRFLYKYAGSFLEEACILCFKKKDETVRSKVKIPNSIGQRPKTFEIDCLMNNEAIEIKWRDATTDGDHITKEHTRVKAIQKAGFKPIRVMFYYPNRDQAMKIQDALKTLYIGSQGEYYCGDEAWEFVKDRTDIDLKGILETLAKENKAE